MEDYSRHTTHWFKNKKLKLKKKKQWQKWRGTKLNTHDSSSSWGYTFLKSMSSIVPNISLLFHRSNKPVHHSRIGVTYKIFQCGRLLRKLSNLNGELKLETETIKRIFRALFRQQLNTLT